MKVSIRNQQRLLRINLQRLKKDSLKLLTAFNLQKTELGVLLVNDARMKQLNRLYRSIDRTTDVLSFATFDSLRDFPYDRHTLIGDIVINLHAAMRQSAAYGFTFNEEVRRLLIHGFLHLAGYDHEKNSYQKKKMIKKEQELLAALEKLD